MKSTSSPVACCVSAYNGAVTGGVIHIFQNEHSASIKHNQLAGLAERSSCQLSNCNDDNEYDLATEVHVVLYSILFWLNGFLGL
jgi:hypothetical protein